MSDRQSLPPDYPTILSFKGPDAIRFLNGQITQDTSKLSDQALTACVTDAKGRLQFYVKILASPNEDTLWVTCPKDQSEGLRDRLERYLIADDVEVDDLTDQWAVIHSSQIESSSEFTRQANGVFGQGFDNWWKPDSLPSLDTIDQATAERLRIQARIPIWSCELSEGILPPEAGLDKSAISYSKGCYIGQEVISRIKTAGKLNRRLAAFQIKGAAKQGDQLLLKASEVGHLTSCAATPDKATDFIALGYLKKKGFDATDFPIAAPDGRPKGTATIVAWA